MDSVTTGGLADTHRYQVTIRDFIPQMASAAPQLLGGFGNSQQFYHGALNSAGVSSTLLPFPSRAILATVWLRHVLRKSPRFRQPFNGWLRNAAVVPIPLDRLALPRVAQVATVAAAFFGQQHVSAPSA